jgi:hypothetical protein
VVSCAVNCSVIGQRLFSATWFELLIVSGGDTRKTYVRKVVDPCCDARREVSWRWNCVWCNKAYTCCEFTSNHCQVAARVVSEPSFLISACRIFGITQLLLCIIDECFRSVSETFPPRLPPVQSVILFQCEVGAVQIICMQVAFVICTFAIQLSACC